MMFKIDEIIRKRLGPDLDADDKYRYEKKNIYRHGWIALRSFILIEMPGSMSG
jgi:hypothetical protein